MNSGDKIFISSGNAPSTHILKPPIRDLEDTVENEALCMMLAQKMGLSTAIKSSLVLKTLKNMATEITPTAQALLKDFDKTYDKCEMIKKIIAVIEKRSKYKFRGLQLCSLKI